MSLKSLLCQHQYSWFERRQCEICYKCGAMRAARPMRRPVFSSDDAASSEPAARPPEPVSPAPRTSPEPINAGGAEALRALRTAGRGRRERLLDRLDRLAEGETLDRHETIDALLAVIEDGQSSDPVLAGDAAATWFAKLSDAASRPH